MARKRYSQEDVLKLLREKTTVNVAIKMVRTIFCIPQQSKSGILDKQLKKLSP